MVDPTPADCPKAFVIGWPINHSRSPLLHGHWLTRLGLPGRYEAVAVAPDDLGRFLETFDQSGYLGGNVTIPHKEAVLAAVDVRDEAAEAIGAVNTLIKRDGVLHGSNTDAFGFLANLDQATPGWDTAGLRTEALLIGAGGAARAVIYGLMTRGFSTIAVVNRSEDRLNRLINDLGPRAKSAGVHLIAVGPTSIATHLRTATLVVNTTSLGMTGQPPLEIDLEPMLPGCVVNDLVYAPLQTPLLAEAKRRGARCVDGLGMLLHQARPGFHLWFGEDPTVDDDLRNAVLAGELLDPVQFSDRAPC